jgi:hypothetical protein
MTQEEKTREVAKRDRMYAKIHGPAQRWQDALDALAYARKASYARAFSQYRMLL